ncbi:hypothetical protein AGMMS50218_12800 [Actinomycetota bacterium]|nr:hypothetical protein AGMMS50218_12800 [Actinomycetota bacterium]
MHLSRRQIIALDRSITPTRLGTYLTVTGGDREYARELYRWDRRLAAAFFADIALLEVALRNALNEQLSRRWGPEWYSHQDLLLDDRTARQLGESWSRVAGEKTPGRVVAQCMFGFWAGLLDKGDHAGRQPRRVRCDYEQQLWRGVLDRAFPGGRGVARAESQRWDRRYAHAVVNRINILRNRVAHHEPLINGYPLPGQQQRLLARDGHDDCLRLAAMLDRDLHATLAATSSVPEILDSRPRRPRRGRDASAAVRGLLHPSRSR